MGVYQMNTAKKILEEIKGLSESDVREVLDFVGYLKSKYKRTNGNVSDVTEFDRFGAVFTGSFNRDECYDRKVLR
jgi:hypothetical protein